MAKIRPACLEDVSFIVELIRDLAEYEKSLDQVQVTEAMLGEALFSEHPAAFAHVAEHPTDEGG